MPKKARRNYQAEEKLSILKEHLSEGKAVSEVCERHGVRPSLFYYWQRQLFENGALALGPTKKVASAKEQRQVERISYLEGRLARKDQVIAELSEDLVQLKKEAGEL
jgi:transposase